ncbi:MAG: hypothetical protein JOZ62_07185, partial [Acidobacteriaceae bacterium]|nr:hypothetical protein [Acidobacteriaceae bacterium]
MLRLTETLALLLWFCHMGISQQFPPVTSAMIEKVQVIPDRKAIRIDVRNLSAKKVTAFQFTVLETGPGNEAVPCTGRGQDMLDWSDPMPGTGMYVHMHRSWIEPNGTVPAEAYLMTRCLDLLDSPQNARVDLRAISFDDGTGEGDPGMLEFLYRGRKPVLDERIKWLPRFIALRTAANLREAAKQLYQDLTDAKYRAESDMRAVQSNGMAVASLQQMQDTVKQIAVY